MAAAKEKDAPATPGTEYAVLEYVPKGQDVPADATGVWVEIDTRTAANKDDAAKRAAGDRGGIFKGVPLRSWRGATKVSTERVVKTTAEAVDL